MIKRIEISKDDENSTASCNYTKNPKLDNADFSGMVVNKPWGYEYLMFQNKKVSIWLLYIKKGYSTSMHCHPNKKTSLLLLNGEAICSTLHEKFNLKEKDSLIFNKGVFHKTEAISEEGIFLIEIETPPDKTDLLRLKDNYKRETKAYTEEKNITKKTYNYHYLFLENKINSTNIFGKYRFLIRSFKNNDAFLKNIGKIESDLGILVSGEISLGNEILNEGDSFEIKKIKNQKIDSPITLLVIQERKNLIKISDFIISFFEKKGINNVFSVAGEKIMHLLESIRINRNMNYLFNHNEQASTMAAESYSKLSGKPGLVIITGGSGATNAITGVAGAWADSIPIIVISGQSFNEQTIGKSKLRQLGVQEINIIDLVRPITKYAVMIRDPRKIKYHLEKALYLATSGRPGPVWLDIPINIHLTKMGEDEIESFNMPEKINKKEIDLNEKVLKTIQLIKEAERPIILLGNGVRLGKAEKEFFELAEKLKIPIVTSRNANDIIWENHELYAGRIGSFGQRYANFTIQNSDLLLSIGSRLSLAVTGWAYNDFAREAKKIIVDIDKAELKKPTIKADIFINCDSKEFLSEMLFQLKDFIPKNFSFWKEKISHWKSQYPVVLPEYLKEKDFVNPYYFTDVLSDELNNDDIIVTDTGMSFHSVMQAFKLKKGQRLFSSSGLGIAGYGLPGAIGACIANNKKRVICITGDGGLMKNIQELETIKHNNLPIKIFVFNNKGYAYMKQLQKNYFKNYIGSDSCSGLSMPDIIKVGESYGIKTKKINNQEKLKEEIKEVLDHEGAVVCDINLSDKQEIIPKQGTFNRPDGKTIPRPIEDMFPYLDREDFDKNMIIDPITFDPYKD